MSRRDHPPIDDRHEQWCAVVDDGDGLLPVAVACLQVGRFLQVHAVPGFHAEHVLCDAPIHCVMVMLDACFMRMARDSAEPLAFRKRQCSTTGGADQ